MRACVRVRVCACIYMYVCVGRGADGGLMFDEKFVSVNVGDRDGE